MNKESSKKEETVNKPKKQRSKDKQDGWFRRNIVWLVISVEVVILIVVLLLACWYTSGRISALKASLERSEEKLENFERSLTVLKENQEQILTEVDEINNKLSKEQAEVESSDKKNQQAEDLKDVGDESVEVETEEFHNMSWDLAFIFVLIILVVLFVYLLMKRLRKKEK